MQENKLICYCLETLVQGEYTGHLTAKYIKRTKMFSYRSVIKILFSLRIQLAMPRTDCLLWFFISTI